jgi:hypothetical protein
LYKEVDWEDFSGIDSEYLLAKGIKVPYFVFDNCDDITTQKGQQLGIRLESAFKNLWKIYSRDR